jgi:hypothetical protein
MAKAKRPKGQPKKWETREALQADVDRYFAYCKEEKRPRTIAGLAYYLEVDRQTIYNYSYKEDYFDIIKKARNRIMMNLEEEAIINGKAGTIFVMKQYGYKDKQEIEGNVEGALFVKALDKFTDKI